MHSGLRNHLTNSTISVNQLKSIFTCKQHVFSQHATVIGGKKVTRHLVIDRRNTMDLSLVEKQNR